MMLLGRIRLASLKYPALKNSGLKVPKLPPPRASVSPLATSACKPRRGLHGRPSIVQPCAEASVPAEESDTKRLPPLCARARGVAGMVISESQIVQIGAEDGLRNERRRRCVDAPEELAGRLVVELRVPFPGRPCNERVYLRTASRRDELSAVELERNVRRLPRRDQSARAIRHLEPSATEHDVRRP